MFTQARLKLTGWYLIIIMAISLSFSGFIYRGVSLELGRRFNQIGKRYQIQNELSGRLNNSQQLLLEDLKHAQNHLFFILLYTNGVIFAFSAIAGYFLAGRTLEPIEKVVEEQKRFVADASHELKTPLTALQTSIEVSLRDKKLTLKNAKTLLRENLDETESLSNLTNNLLSLTRIQSEQNGFYVESVDIKEIVKASIKKVEPLAKKNKVKIKVRAESCKLKADSNSLEKLITILLDNAVKYSKKNTEIRLSLKKEKKCATIQVKDVGVGISKRDLPHIFDRFYRADESRSKTKVSGFGLGLSIAKKIVDLHNGKISVKSKIGKGSTFTVKLPIS